MTARPNLLVTSAGRRVQLVRFFQRALATTGISGRVLVAEANPEWSAAARTADDFAVAPRVTDPAFESFLLDYVERERVGLVVPTIDTELQLLARLRAPLAALGCHVAVSDTALVETCRDKRRSDAWFRDLGFDTPRLMARETLEFPCFAKPYDGSMSRGARAIRSAHELTHDLLADEKLMFMELFAEDEYDEFTVDAYYDRNGNLRCLVPRRRVEVRGGESSKGLVVKGPTYEYLLERLGRIRGARGCLTLQFFVSRLRPRWIASECNPRFGGGYPLSQAAGADYPVWLVREYLLRETIPFFDGWRDRTAMARFDDEVIFTLGDP